MKLMNTLYLMLIAVLLSTSTVTAQNIILGTGTSTNGTTTASPINIFYRSLRYQTVYTAAELSAAGAAPGQILQIGWYVTSVPIYDMPNYTISMKHTSATNASTHDGIGLTQVYNNPLYAPTAGGWDMLTLQTPFIWNGVDNILVDVCFDQTNPTWNSSGQVRTYSASNGARYSRSDVTNQCGLNTGTTLQEKAQVNFFIQSGPAPNCTMVDNGTLVAQNITANTADILWDSTSSPLYYLIEYGTLGFLPGSGISDTTSSLNYQLSGLTPITDYTVRVQQICGTAVGDTSYARTVNFKTPCATVPAPFQESFEGGGIDCIFATTAGGPLTTNTTAPTWGVHTGATSSISTGPSAAFDGTKYVYLETSGGATGSTDTLYFNPVDLSPLSTPTLSFWYHMYGATMGTMKVQVATLGTNTWTEVFNLSGDQGNQWNLFSTSLNSFAGQTVVMRLVGVRGTSFTSDMAIDDVNFDDAPANDATITDFIAPIIGGCNVLSTNETVTVEIANFGSDTLTSATVTLTINGAQVASGTFSGVIPPNGTSNYTFPQGIDLSAQGLINIGVSASALPTEDVPWNDANSFIKFNDGNSIVSTYPYTQTFDSWNSCVSNCVDNACGTFGQSSGWRNSVGDDDSDWSVNSGTTPTGGTGPNSDHTSGTGKYLYTEAAGCSDFYLLSPCFDFSSIQFPELSFWYNMNGNSVGTLTVEIDTTGQGSWVSIWSLSGSQGNTWQEAEIDLTNFQSYTSKFRFSVTMGAGTSSDIAIDDILVRNVAPHDLQITNVLGPSNGCGDENVYIDVTVFNYGSASENDYTITVNQTGLATNSISVNETTVLNDEDSIVVAVGPFSTALGGVVGYNASVVINNATDNVPNNNSGSYQHEAYALSYPQGVDGTRCGFGPVTLGATGVATEFFWYTDSSATDFVATGTSFTTDYLYNDTTYWIEGRAPYTDFFAPQNKNFDEGGFYDYYPDGLVFDAHYDITINAVTVYPLGPGDITINVEDASGTVINTATYTHLTLASVVSVPLGFDVPAGVGYKINATGTNVELFRNKDNNNVIGTAYPYHLDDAVSITGPINNLFDSYYFFYNWKVTYLGCPSDRVPVQAILTPSGLTPSFAVTDESLPGNGAISTTVSGGTAPYTFTWNNGLTTNDIAGLNAGTYMVTISDANDCTDTFNVVIDNIISTNEIPSISNLSIFPNPSNGQFNVSIELDGIHEVAIEVINSLGQVIYRTSPESIAARQYPINLVDKPAGIYQLRIRVDNETTAQPILIK